MMNNYVSRYSLEFNPFIKNSQEILVETSEYREIVFRLNNLLLTKGFGLITGELGRGKTTVIRNWVKSLNPLVYKVIYISMSTLTVVEFYRQLASELNVEPAHRKIDNFRSIQSAINRLAMEKKMTPIIIIDEANYINSSILNDLKIIFNFDMDSSDKAVVLLVGLPKLNSTLQLTAHEPLRQRITMNYHLAELSKDEARKYIKEKLSGAGCQIQVFENAAIEAIINSANGTARIINSICDKSMFIGNNLNKNVIDSNIVLSAINELAIG